VDPAEYPGKAKSLEQLKSDWDREDKSLHSGEFGYCKYGGFASTRRRPRASSASSRSMAMVVRRSGRAPVHLHGVNGMGSTGGSTRVTGREKYFAGQPPADLRWERRAGARGVGDFYGWKPGAALRRRLGHQGQRDGPPPHGRLGLNTAGAGFRRRSRRPMPPCWRARRPRPYTWVCPMSTRRSLPAPRNPRRVAVDSDEGRCLCAGILHRANEPAWPGRESELGRYDPERQGNRTQRRLKAFLAAATPRRGARNSRWPLSSTN